MAKQLKSHEIVTLAVFFLGGDSRFVDTEDVAVTANDLAPGLFTWQKYKDQISFDHVRRKLTEATATDNGALLIGSVRRGWQLTRAGLDFSIHESERFNENRVANQRLNSTNKMRLRLERERIISSKAYQKFRAGAKSEITIAEACSIFRVDEYVPADIREGKILRVENNFAEDSDLGEAIRFLSDLLRKEKISA